MKDTTKLDMTMEAAKTEFFNLLETMKAMKPCHSRDIPREHRCFIINGHLFFKDQYNTDGTFKRRKARFVMNGNEQDPTTIDETRAPTVNPISFMCTLVIAAQDEEREVDGYNFVGAFPCTEIRNGKIFIVRVGGAQARLLVQIFPHLKVFMDDKGFIYFYLLKFVYGLAEAAFEFNLMFEKCLKALGFTASDCDPCLYTKDVEGAKHILCGHVDDIFSTLPNAKARIAFFEEGIKQYFEIKEQHGVLSYLGMVITKE